MNRKRTAAAVLHGKGESSSEPMRATVSSPTAPVVRGSSRRITTMMAGFTRSTKVSRPRESHPKPLAEPYVTLSCHTAPIVRTGTLPKASQWTNNRGCLPLMLCNQHSDRCHFPANLRYLRRAQRMRV